MEEINFREARDPRIYVKRRFLGRQRNPLHYFFTSHKAEDVLQGTVSSSRRIETSRRSDAKIELITLKPAFPHPPTIPYIKLPYTFLKIKFSYVKHYPFSKDLDILRCLFDLTEVFLESLGKSSRTSNFSDWAVTEEGK